MKRIATVFVVVVALAAADLAVAGEASGTVKSVDPQRQLFVLADGEQKQWTFLLAKAAKVFVDDKEARLGDLRAGQAVTVTYEKDGDRLMATIVRGKAK
jgi:hypothetical protein